MIYGLKESIVEQINSIFVNYPSVEQVILYGSRAKGNYKNGSDIDLTMIGNNIKHMELLAIMTKIDDLLLPYSIDLSIYHKINNSNLQEHINRVGKIFYQRKTNE